MHHFYYLLFLSFFSILLNAQVSTKYTISFENAIQHEAQIEAVFTNLKSKEAEFTMARSSPGRYALHEFVKNVYNVKVTDGDGKELKVTRPNPYTWNVTGHNGTISVSYTLFANHGDGTYAQVDATHAHLNIPATFIYVPELANQEIEVTFMVREDLNWKVATQLKHIKGTTYYAKDFQYFMDSPTEIANLRKRSLKVKDQIVSLVLHDDTASNADLDTYFENVKKIVLEQEKVFGELPTYDYGEYTFLACYMPNATGDGMEHRNSTYVVNTRSLSRGGIEQNIGTVSHEFFHGWNVERIRPKSLEPFDFSKANMSGELWFAEGFTNYYDALTLCRTGLWSLEKYVSDMNAGFNYVWASPGRQFYNPIEMSYQAPFVDAAKSVDETNKENTFISYYTYGEMLGLALDLSLREQNLNLDDYMKLVWNNFGEVAKFYTVADLNKTLNTYAGAEFGDFFFNSYIYKSDMPDFETLFKNMGIELQSKEEVDFGASVRDGKIMSNSKIRSSAYVAGLQKNDKILQFGEFTINSIVTLDMVLNKFKVGDEVKIIIQRFDDIKEVNIILTSKKVYNLSLMNANSTTDDMIKNRTLWLNEKR
jgi:predicted metalloprotease with PDZ domain